MDGEFIRFIAGLHVAVTFILSLLRWLPPGWREHGAVESAE